ncbi:MAG: hypothetical protein DIJKHBIC_00700 [Thermoanaerobaculia bacterium]|nr:hypothetical protein [Thermoanaerobaculia bacterium]
MLLFLTRLCGSVTGLTGLACQGLVPRALAGQAP